MADLHNIGLVACWLLTVCVIRAVLESVFPRGK